MISTKCLLALALALQAAVACGQADNQKLWQGTFTTSNTLGAMEMTVGQGSERHARLRLASDGRTADSEASQLKLSATTISFLATFAGKEYRFTGTHRNNQWQGELVATDGRGDQGSWRMALVDVRNTDVNSNDPLPTPTGKYSTGRTIFHWVDQTRPEMETRTPEDRRELLVYVFYPSRVDEANEPAALAPYMPEAEVMRAVWNDELTDRLKRIQGHSRESVALAKGRKRFPVVIFAPGAGWKALAYTTLLEDLASHGYVVAAIEPPYNAPAMRFPDGRVIRRLPPAERGWAQPKNRDESLQLYQERVVYWARDMCFVLDRLVALDQAKGLFSHRLDLTHVGAFGHSHGGQAAGTARLLDPRFRGAINIDGNEKGTGFELVSGREGGKQPFLWIEGPYQHPTETDLQQAGITEAQWKEMYADGDRQMRSVEGGGLRITITRIGIEHMDFSDNALWNVSASPDVRAGKLRTLEETRRYVLAFFDGCLKNRWNALRALVTETGNAYPDIFARKFGALWP